MKRGTPRNPKVLHLANLLKTKVPTAVGYLELLWHFTADFAPQGDVGKFDDRWIEAALFWTGRSGFLIRCLTNARWLDDHSEYRIIVHDWHDHADDAVRKKLARAGLQFLTFTKKATGRVLVSDRTLSATLPENGGLPEPCLASAGALPEPEPPIAFPSQPAWRLDETYLPFVAAWQRVAQETGKPLIDEDFVEAHFRWGRLDFDQKLLAVKTTNDHLDLGVWTGATDPQFVPLPKKYLELEYKRPVVAPKARDSPALVRKNGRERWIEGGQP